MANKYNKPPIKEVILDIKLSNDSTWDLTIPGLYYEKLRGLFPNKNKITVPEPIFIDSPHGIVQTINNRELIKLTVPDNKTFIEIGDHQITIHQLEPYPGWNNLLPIFHDSIKELMELIHPNVFDRLGLRYVNQINIPGEIVSISDYFDYGIQFEYAKEKIIKSFIIGMVLPFENDRDFCRIQLTPNSADQSGYHSSILDIDYFTGSQVTISIEDIYTWMNSAHSTIETIFENCIKDPLRKLFEAYS
jgi:uncharacterized protein (TIGR04255 family)